MKEGGRGRVCKSWGKEGGVGGVCQWVVILVLV